MRFEEYAIDRARWQLRYRDEALPLSRKTFDLLIYLAEHTDRVVSKDELLRALWPDSFVEESNLTQHVFLLRKTLSRHQSGSRIIETVPGRGYRFAVPVELDDVPPPPAEESVDTLATGDAVTIPTASRAISPLLLWPLLLLAAGVTLGIFYLRWRASNSRSVSTYTQITHDGHGKWLGGTDGSRLYFTQLDKDEIAQIAVSGGIAAPLPLAIKNPWSGSVSPDGSVLLVISQANGQGPANALWSVHLVGGALRHLGSAISSAWSPDGERIVYASAGGDLSIMRSDGSENHRIASPGGYIKSIAWSPDGHTIRFTKDGSLWEVSPEGSNLHPFLPAWGATPTQWNGEWSRDGRFFFVADGEIWMVESERGLLPNKGPHPVQLTFGPVVWDHPIPSPDGRKLFASGRVRRGELVRMNAASARFEPFLAGISAEFVTFSSTKKYVAYVSYPEGILWRADADGSNAVQLTRPPLSPKTLCWSPDGSQIAFVNRSEGGADAIFLIASDGTGEPHRLILDDRQAETDPSWSSDGRQIVYATSPNVGASARSDLHTFDLASKAVAVVPGSNGFLAPRWSPDGRSLAAMTLDGMNLALLDLASGHWTRLETGPLAFPEWSHDSRWLYYVGWNPNPALWRIRASDGTRELVSNLDGLRFTGTYTLWMGLDPDDSPMLLRDEGTDDIYALSLDAK